MTWLAFTGTQHGMTIAQQLAVQRLIQRLLPIAEVAHGDCIGADRDFDDIVTGRALPLLDLKPSDLVLSVQRIVLHPASDVEPRKRALCHQRFPRPRTIVRAPRPALERNRLIVDGCSELIACPSTHREVLRSGTWATVRYARRAGVRHTVVWPDGRCTLAAPADRTPGILLAL